MLRFHSPSRFRFRACILPILQAVLTSISTTLGVILVVQWHPKRTQYIPFYSDATHNDPERIILAIGENLACFFMPLVALAEFLHHSCLAISHTRPALGTRLFRILPINRVPTTRHLVLTNFAFTSATAICFFVTANVPSKYPYTFLHQCAASSLIFMYAVQAVLKTILANTFSNYDKCVAATYPGASETLPLYNKSTAMDIQHEKNIEYINRMQKKGWRWEGIWNRHHLKLRILLASNLWGALVVTWICYIGRVITNKWGSEWDTFRRTLAIIMAVVVHLATASCITLMATMAIDMRHQFIVLAEN